MEATNISLYSSVKDTASTQTIGIDQFLEGVQNGRWEDKVNKIRTIQDVELRRAEKAKLPNVTISGIFTKRVDKECKLHSGFIAIDIDNLGSELAATKMLLAQDPYVYAAFMSVSGTGLCALIRVDPERHRDAFEGIADYMIKKYQIVIDPTGVNVSRARFVSFDPDLFVQKSIVFKKYLTKPKSRKIQATIFVQTEFDDVVRQMVDLRVSCVEDYRDWRDIGFGLADQFGEGGRQYFHSLSSCSDKYETTMCDRQYTHCMRSNQHRGGSKVTIATIYWFAKQAGIQVLSERTKKIAAATTTLKKNGLDAAAIADNLAKFDNITGADDIIKQAFAANQDFTGGESIIENVRVWLRHNYQLRRNMITRKIENMGRPLDEVDLNGIFLEAKIAFDDLTFDLFCKIVFSPATPSYHPILDWFEAHKDDPRDSGVIDRFFATISTPDDAVYFGKKWLVGAVSAVYGTHSPLMLILAGKLQGTGKTEFFRRMLPPDLRAYYAESKLDAGKDDEILMTQKWFIADDEMGGKSKKESKRLKELTSKQTFTLREPYGRMNVDLNRLAVLCGSTNDLEILSDATGNRRQLPVEVMSIDHHAYNSIDKSALLMEAWHLYKEGFDWEVKSADVAKLAAKSERFEETFAEDELLSQFFQPSEDMFFTTTQIKNLIETRTVQKLNLKRLGMALHKRFHRTKRMGFFGWNVAPIVELNAPPPIITGSELPF